MSRDDEDRILHGLYFHREDIDQEERVNRAQMLWLAMHPLQEGDTWSSANGKPQSLDASEFPADIRSKLVTAKLELPLRYLQYRRLIRYTRHNEEEMSVAVTFAGADRAIRLHTRRGRMDLWYREHKDGFLGIAVTVIVAFLTALFTVLALK